MVVVVLAVVLLSVLVITVTSSRWHPATAVACSLARCEARQMVHSTRGGSRARKMRSTFTRTSSAQPSISAVYAWRLGRVEARGASSSAPPNSRGGNSDVTRCHSRSFLTACRKKLDVSLPLAVRKPNLVIHVRLAALTL